MNFEVLRRRLNVTLDALECGDVVQRDGSDENRRRQVHTDMTDLAAKCPTIARMHIWIQDSS